MIRRVWSRSRQSPREAWSQPRVIVVAVMVWWICVAGPPQAFAQQTDGAVDRERSVGDEQSEGQEARSAEEVYADAMSARESGDYQRALDLVELAQRKSAQPRYTFREVTLLEEMGRHERALSVLESNRSRLADVSTHESLAVVEQRLREAVDGGGEANGAEGSESSGGGRPLDWVLLGSGIATLGGGGASLLVAEGKFKTLNCYGHRNAAGCSDRDVPASLTRAEYDRRTRRARTLRILGGSLMAVGGAATVWGIVRMVSVEREPAQRASKAARVRVRPVVGRLVGAKVKIQF